MREHVCMCTSFLCCQAINTSSKLTLSVPLSSSSSLILAAPFSLPYFLCFAVASVGLKKPFPPFVHVWNATNLFLSLLHYHSSDAAASHERIVYSTEARNLRGQLLKLAYSLFKPIEGVRIIINHAQAKCWKSTMGRSKKFITRNGIGFQTTKD